MWALEGKGLLAGACYGPGNALQSPGLCRPHLPGASLPEDAGLGQPLILEPHSSNIRRSLVPLSHPPFHPLQPPGTGCRHRPEPAPYLPMEGPRSGFGVAARRGCR